MKICGNTLPVPELADLSVLSGFIGLFAAILSLFY
jgi:hypothetical protein